MESTTKNYRGYLMKFLSKKSNNSWALALFGHEENLKLQIKIKGNIADMQPKVLYEINGIQETHSKFGTSFNVENYKIAEVNSPNSTIKYLASPVFPGIGLKAATNIVDFYQDEVLTKIKNNPESLHSVPGLNKNQVGLIINKIKSWNEEDLRPLFYENNLNLEIYDQVKKMTESIEETKSIFKNNFFAFARKNKFQPFEQVDKIALFFGLEKFSPERIAYWSEKVALNIAFNTGNTYTNLPILKRQLKKVLEIDDDQIIQAGLVYAKNHQLLYFSNYKVYANEAWEDEMLIVEGLTELMNVNTEQDLTSDFDKILNEIEKEVAEILKIENFKYDLDQVLALKTFLKSPIALITGGPGTGKTTLITGIILFYEKIFKSEKIGIAAPTGRASARLKEALSDNRPSTIHKMLEADEKGNFGINEKFPLDFELIILDETSMVENHLFAQLIKARGKKLKKIVLVGDNNQLPPVGYGEIFSDLINSKKFAFCQLKQIHRQKEGNGIIDLAWAIQENKILEIEWDKLSNVETHFDQSLNSNFQMLKLDYALNQKDNEKSPFHYQIIAPFYAGELGIEALNSFIQLTFNENLNNNELVYDRGRYRYTVNDKIMNLKNNPELDLTNGEMGIIQKIEFINKKFNKATAEFNNDKKIELNNTLFNDIALGYACSVHKTQGSEYQNVAFVIEQTNNNFFLNKKLIYTAITRAKANLLIIGDYQLFLRACLREAKPRLTTIKEKLLTEKTYKSIK